MVGKSGKRVPKVPIGNFSRNPNPARVETIYNIPVRNSPKRTVDYNYFDKGTMATIGRNKAVVDLNKSTFGGFFAWFIWMFVHLWFLVGFRNRVVTFFNWTYSYINFDRAARLIIRPFKMHKVKLEHKE